MDGVVVGRNGIAPEFLRSLRGPRYPTPRRQADLAPGQRSRPAESDY